jgi:hypothetical protein
MAMNSPVVNSYNHFSNSSGFCRGTKYLASPQAHISAPFKQCPVNAKYSPADSKPKTNHKEKSSSS